MQRTRVGERGQAIVEMAFAAPVFFFLLFASFQLALVVMHSYNVRQVTRETARWLAIHPDTTDAAVAAQAIALRMPPMREDAFERVTATPACPTLTAGKCANRAAGEILSVEVEYDVADALFLPGFEGLTLPPYRVSVLIE
jgi:Flp pilus assembly protein TadG